MANRSMACPSHVKARAGVYVRKSVSGIGMGLVSREGELLRPLAFLPMFAVHVSY